MWQIMAGKGRPSKTLPLSANSCHYLPILAGNGRATMTKPAIKDTTGDFALQLSETRGLAYRSSQAAIVSGNSLSRFVGTVGTNQRNCRPVAYSSLLSPIHANRPCRHCRHIFLNSGTSDSVPFLVAFLFHRTIHLAIRSVLGLSLESAAGEVKSTTVDVFPEPMKILTAPAGLPADLPSVL